MVETTSHHFQPALRFLTFTLSPSTLTSIIKTSKVSGHLLLRETKDPLVTAAVPKLKVGRWNVEGAVTTAEGEAQFRRILGSFQ